jgi:hypothetical protein
MSRESTEPLLARFGCVQIVSGCHLNAIGLKRDDEENLLYIVIIGPVMLHGEANGDRSDGFTNESFITILNHSWNDGSRASSVDIRWDRRADSISVGKYTFNRRNGDVFLMEFATDGNPHAQQFSNLEPSGGPHQLLQYLRRELPDNKVLSSMRLLNDPH